MFGARSDSHRRPRWPGALVLVMALLLAPAVGEAAGAQATPKLAPSLARAAAQTPGDSISAWIEFTDKGERGPADLAARLVAARAALSPRALARRLRARVSPVVDELDLPVEPAYLAGLIAHGLRPYGASRWFNRVAVRIPARDLPGVAALPFVARLVPVETMRRSPDPEPAAALRGAPIARASAIGYGLTAGPIGQLDVPAVHDSGYTGSGVLICVLDEGFNFFDKHEALRDHVIPAERQRDFYRGLATAQDTTDPTLVHGTWVLGLMAGRKFDTYVGTAFDAEYALGRTEVRIFERPEEMVYWGMGAEWADSLGADIISTSLTYTTFDDPLDSYVYADMDGHTTLVTRAAEIAAAKGILVFAAVGNDGAAAWHYLGAPADANGDSVVAVGAVDASGAPASFSSWGPSADGRVKPDVVAGGVSISTCGTSGDPSLYSNRSGTSFATPLVAGLAACLMQARPGWTPSDIARALRGSASQSGAPDPKVGYGIPDGLLALAYQPGGGGGGPGPGITVRLGGPNPVVFSRGPARFSLAMAAGRCGQPATLRVHDAQGRRVRELWSGVVSCGLVLPVSWDGRDDDGHAVAPGVYLVDLRSGGEHASLRIVGLR